MRLSRALVPTLCVLTLALVLIAGAPVLAAPEGQVVWGVHISLAPHVCSIRPRRRG